MPLPIIQDPPPLWGDGSLYGDGDLYYSALGVPKNFIAYTETQCVRAALRIQHTRSGVAGLSDQFAIYDARAAVAPIRQVEHTWEAYVDVVTPSERLAVRVTHTGANAFCVANVRLKANRKHHQPKG